MDNVSDKSITGSQSTMVTSRAILKDLLEPYVFLIHTGTNNPALEKIEKWEDGQMNFILNPHTDNASELFHVKELFPANREDHVRVSRYLPSFVGEPVQIKINVESNKLEIIKDALYIREITIKYNYRLYRFPINDYLYPHNPLLSGPNEVKYGCPPYVIVKSGPGTLLGNEKDPAILAARLEELKLRRKHVEWANNDDEFILPAMTKQIEYDDLPRFLKFKNARQKAFQLNLKRGHNMMKWTVIENKIATYFGKDTPDHFSGFREFKQVFLEQAEDHGYDKGMVYQVLQIMKCWKEDEEFVRQELNGINPSQIRRCNTLPATWSDMPPIPGHVMGDGVSLEDEVAAGRVYIIETSLLEVVGDGGMLMPILTGFPLPMIVTISECVFYLDRSDVLRPVGIRIEYKNGGEAPTFWFPPRRAAHEDSHEYLSWLLAKMYFKSANMQIHAILSHFLLSHAVPETFAIGMYRCLPCQHPLHKLLVPHVSGIIPINVQGRQFLTKSNGVMAALMSAGDRLWKLADAFMREFRYDHLSLPLDLETRQVSELPGYHFRDDAVMWWDALIDYCSDFISIHYKTDQTVVGDSELQNMVHEIRTIGFKKIPDCAGFPDSISTISSLVEYCTSIIYNSSIRHTAVNFAQFNILAYVPNAPCAMTLSPPKQDEEVTMERILLSLPVKEMARVQIDISYSLTLFSPVEKFYLGSIAEDRLGLMTETTMVDEEELDCVERLIETMKKMKKKINARNERLKIPYDVISPINTPLTVQT